ncbi:hypothetical protein P43SY_004618 [Pythium insidiosum]|uniref:AB hydrolase-1 domain-containing protein n=1 Tax=Pythium insidiosum TaxID=114742 RepID=A0AAD5Q3K1_PYTIN|nr:hypothetical protein P43SY_004618 [Pythium insidiosum]
MAERRVRLLFAHGGSFCKQVWAPITRRLQAMPAMQRVQAECMAFDMPFHGERRDVSQRPELHLENPAKPRVSHPTMRWMTWGPAEVARQVASLQASSAGSQRIPLIGIGHSLGAASLWATEMASPGTFDGLILFEPMTDWNGHPYREKAIDFHVGLTLQRRAAWDSFEEAQAELSSSKSYARWHPESLQAYIQGAVVKSNPENNVLDADKNYVLACHPHLEAAGYCGGLLPMAGYAVDAIKCRVFLQYGGRTQLFFPEYYQSLVQRFPQLYRIDDAVPNTTHALVLEDPDAVATRINSILQELAPFQMTLTCHKGLKMAAVKLLFAHGGGFCGRIWEPITRRLAASALLQRTPADMITFDFPYHGARRDVSQPATLRVEQTPHPRVQHIAGSTLTRWTQEEVERQVNKIRANDGHERVPVIGIGHSMGACGLWTTEIKHPGTFAGLILFEPVHNVSVHPESDATIDFLVSITLPRKWTWDTFEEAQAELLATRNFARFHPESLQAYIDGAVVKSDGATNPLGPTLSHEDLARVQCPTTFQYGSRSQLFFRKYIQPHVDAFPATYRIAEPVENTTHALVMEDPDTVAARILSALEELPPYCA